MVRKLPTTTTSSPSQTPSLRRKSAPRLTTCQRKASQGIAIWHTTAWLTDWLTADVCQVLGMQDRWGRFTLEDLVLLQHQPTQPDVGLRQKLFYVTMYTLWAIRIVHTVHRIFKQKSKTSLDGLKVIVYMEFIGALLWLMHHFHLK